jgi:outer membrane lipoprotein-sorting protein
VDRITTFLSVLAPAEDTNKALLAIERPDQPTQAVSYLAGLKKLTKITSDKRLGYRNAKVAVQDMLGLELGQYDHGAGARVNLDGESLIKVEFKEKPWRGMAYPRIIGFFREKDQTPARFELYDHRDELQKRVMVEEIKTIQSRQTITRLAIEDLQQKLKVKVETRKIEYDHGLPDSLFTEERLKSVISNAVQKLDQQ